MTTTTAGSGTDRYLTFAQAAKALGVSRPTVYAMVRRGELDTESVAGKPHVLRESVAQTLEARAVTQG